MEVGVATLERVLDAVETVVVPVDEQLRPAVREEGEMDADGFGLADAVEAADPLFEQFGIERQVEEHEVVGKLEVAALAADFGAEQDARAFRLGKPGGIAVALQQGELLVERGLP